VSERQAHVGPGDGAADRESVAQAASVGEQILDQNRPLRRMGSIQRPGRIVKYPHVGEFRQPAHDRIAQCQFALVDQAHQGGDRHRLTHRRDPKQRVALHRQPGIDIAVADFVDLQHFSALPHHRHRTGE
jgi:hypothetical protein